MRRAPDVAGRAPAVPRHTAVLGVVCERLVVLEDGDGVGVDGMLMALVAMVHVRGREGEGERMVMCLLVAAM